MKDKLTETIGSLLASVIATSLSVWRVINWIEVRNVIDLITSVLLMCIAIAGLGKILRGWEFPIIKTKTKPERTTEIALEPEKKIKGVVTMFLKLSELLKSLRRTTWANKLTLSGELLLTSWFLLIVHVFFKFYGMTFENQAWHFWVILGAIVMSYVFLLIVVAKEGIESWDDFVARVGNKKIVKLMDKVVKVGIRSNPEKAQEVLDRAKNIYDEIKGYLDTDTRKAFEDKLSEIQAEIDYVLGERAYLEDQRRKYYLEIKQKHQAQDQIHQSPQPPHNNGGVRRL